MTNNLDFIILTTHAKQRALRRYLMQAKEIKELAWQAIQDGFSANDAPTKEMQRYMESKITDEKSFYVYGGYGFILVFHDDHVRVVTTFRLAESVLNKFNQ